MMRRILVGAAVLFTLLVVTVRPAQAQGLASLATAATSAMAVEKTPSCWTCQSFPSVPSMCVAGSGSGSYAKCGPNFNGIGCTTSSACGSSALAPVDIDGASQYVSRGSRLGVLASHIEGDPDVKRNCKGVVVARFQTADAIAQVRSSTESLTL